MPAAPLLPFLGGVGGVVSADAGHGAVLDSFNGGGHILRLADGRVDLVLQAAVIKPEVMGVTSQLTRAPRRRLIRMVSTDSLVETWHMCSRVP